MLHQHLSQKMLQKLSPQQIQLMKLLQIPTVNLEQRIKEELEINPALEEGEGDWDIDETEGNEGTDANATDYDYLNEDMPADFKEIEDDYANDLPTKEDDIPTRDEDASIDDYMQEYIDDDIASYKLAGDYQTEEEEKTSPISVHNSFHEYLIEQLGLVNLSRPDATIAVQIIGSIDDDGYLRREIYAIVDDLAFSLNIITTEEEVLRLLKIIQQFEPPGIGARHLQECLEIQLNRKLAFEDGGYDREAIQIGLQIIQKYFNEFTKKHYDRLQRLLEIKEPKLKEAIDEILKLNPKPASGYAGGSREIQYIVPDFMLNNVEGELELSLNSRNAPDLRVSNHYREMMQAYSESSKGRKEKEAVLFIKTKIDAAKWFIDAIKQRQQTMYKTMLAITQHQYEYFMTGDEKRLRPMILKDIAEMTDLDISTVSRVVSSKYVQTEFGTKSLKAFFSESLQTENGDEVSTLEVKNILLEFIAGENKRHPLSDEILMDMLLDLGYNIARRTVAKYREQLNIPVARLRKQL